jgi:hypothetical protein
LTFLEQNPEVKTFDLYWPSWEFLKDSLKFISTTHANAAASVTASRERKQSFLPTDSPWNTSSRNANLKYYAPYWQKESQKKQEKENILEKITEKLSSGGQGNAVMVLAGALTKFANIFASGLQE